MLHLHCSYSFILGYYAFNSTSLKYTWSCTVRVKVQLVFLLNLGVNKSCKIEWCGNKCIKLSKKNGAVFEFRAQMKSVIKNYNYV